MQLRPVRARALTLTVVIAAAALAGPSLGAEPRSALTHLQAPAGTWFVRGQISGEAGRTVVVHAGGMRSAPLRLDGSRQSFGISGSSAAPVALPLSLEALDGAPLGKQVLLEDVEALASGPTRTFVGTGRVIMAEPNGGTAAAFIAKGYNYTSLPIGGQPLYQPGLQDPATCQRDARLLSGAGVNAVRALLTFIERVDVPALVGCMDAFHANGIAIAWLEQGLTEASTVVDAEQWMTLWQQKIQPAINVVSNHPATHFWVLGNEVEIQSPTSGPAWYGHESGRVGLLESLASYVRAHDPNHMVGTSVAGPNWHILATANVPSLQFWGVNMYPRPGNELANSVWADNLRNADPRPIIITEIGTDRLKCLRAVDSQVSQALSTAMGATPAWRTYTCAAGSGDHLVAQAEQAAWNAGVWDDLVQHLATPSNPNGAFSGALYFMATDWWWFNILTNGIGTMHTHETQGFVFQMSDSNFNPEFAGSMYAQLDTATDMRMTSLSFDAMGARWSAIPPPTVTGAGVSVTGCNATVSWTTSEASASEVLLAVDGADPLLSVDNTLFEQAAYVAAPTTAHSVTLALTPGVPHRLAGRSFTADGRHGTTGPLMVTACTG